MRILPFWRNGGTPTSGFWYDEGVYFFASQQLWSGTLPYRDFQFVHPPGMLVALGPSAGLAQLFGDAAAAGITRIAIALIGAACAAMIAYLLLDYGTIPAFIGGGLYAVWSAVLWSDTSILMQPLLCLGLLAALILLRGNRFSWAGVALGLTLTVKLWAIVPLVVIGVWIAFRHGRSGAGRFAFSAVVTAAVVALPFFLLAPGDMVSDIVGFQSGRPRGSIGVAERLFDFTGSVLAYDRLPSVLWLITGIVAVVLVALPLLSGLRDDKRASGATEDRADAPLPEPALWSALALTQLAAVLLSPSFFNNYTAFPAPALCLVLGFGMSRALPHLRANASRVVAVGAAIVFAFLAVMSLRVIKHEPPTPPIADVLGDHRCIWTFEPDTLVEAGLSGRQAARGCPGFVDRYAVAVTELKVSDDDLPDALPGADDYQRQVAEQFRSSDAVVINGDELRRLAPDTVAVLHNDFERNPDLGEYQVWVKPAR